jgi:hypothetical protein
MSLGPECEDTLRKSTTPVCFVVRSSVGYSAGPQVDSPNTGMYVRSTLQIAARGHPLLVQCLRVPGLLSRLLIHLKCTIATYLNPTPPECHHIGINGRLMVGVGGQGPTRCSTVMLFPRFL